MARPTIADIGPAPSLSDPATFPARADATLGKLGQLVAEINEATRWLEQDFAGELANGTALAPAIRAKADTDTGLYFPALDQLAAAVAGVRRWLLSSAAFQIDVPITGTAVTQSATDTTAGRLLKVGDFGLGNKFTPSSIANLDATDNAGGWYRVESIASGNTAGTRPAGFTDIGAVMVVRYDSTRTTQIFYPMGQQGSAIRHYNGGWSAWEVLLQSGDKTQSATDTTAGRLLKVGDFGLGGTGSLPPPGNAAIEGIPTGYYTTDAVTTGTGELSPGNGLLWHLQRGTGTGNPGALQIWQRGSTADGFVSRLAQSGVWGKWQRLFKSDNILGTVSQSAGVPTGAIIERGSNGNGEYVRLADGTQICWHYALAVWGSSSALAYNWIMPAAFSVRPNIQLTPLHYLDGAAPSGGTWNGSPVVSAYSRTTAATSCNVYVSNPSNNWVSTDKVPLHFAAIGRWY